MAIKIIIIIIIITRRSIPLAVPSVVEVQHLVAPMWSRRKLSSGHSAKQTLPSKVLILG